MPKQQRTVWARRQVITRLAISPLSNVKFPFFFSVPLFTVVIFYFPAACENIEQKEQADVEMRDTGLAEGGDVGHSAGDPLLCFLNRECLRVSGVVQGVPK